MPPTLALSASQAQIEALVDFMSENSELARGLLRGDDGRLKSKRLWESLCISLNAMGSCTKSLEQWQRVWADKKHLCKKTAAAARRLASATGGGSPAAPALSQVELKILSVMGQGFGGPQTEARVPAFPLPTPVEHCEIICPDLPSFSVPASQEHPSTSFTQDSAGTNPRRGRPCEPRRRQRLAPYSTKTRLIELEEERNEELRQIKNTMVDLCQLLREYICKQNNE